MYHDTKRRRNSHTSGTSCTILTDQHSTGQDGGPAVHHPWSSSSLVSASTQCTRPLPLLIITCHLLPRNTSQMRRCRGQNRQMVPTDRESRLGPHRAQLSNAVVYNREVGTTPIPLVGPITYCSMKSDQTGTQTQTLLELYQMLYHWAIRSSRVSQCDRIPHSVKECYSKSCRHLSSDITSLKTLTRPSNKEHEDIKY